jgi:carbonic anhydrase
VKEKAASYISRRTLLRFIGTAIGTGLVAGKLGVDLFDAPAAEAKENLTSDSAIEKLMAGNKRFATQKTQQPNRGSFRLREVANGQNPFAAILGCADSRVPAEIVFDQGLGDLFVVRVAGNIATPEEIGSLEYGTLVLGAKVVLVLGHQKCGAVKATIENKPVPGKIGSVLAQIRPAVLSSKGKLGDSLKNATVANIKNQIATLKTSPVLADLIKTGKLKIVGGYYDLDTGVVTTVA